MVFARAAFQKCANSLDDDGVHIIGVLARERLAALAGALVLLAVCALIPFRLSLRISDAGGLTLTFYKAKHQLRSAWAGRPKAPTPKRAPKKAPTLLPPSPPSLPRPLAIDLGMNNGQTTRHFLKRHWRVVGVEANPELAARNAANFSTVTVHNLAIGPRPGNATFCFEGPGSISSHVAEDGRRCRKSLVVVTATCAMLLREHGRPHVLKIDVEGQEVSKANQIELEPYWKAAVCLVAPL